MLHVAFPEQMQRATPQENLQRAMQRMCNKDIKTIAIQRLKRIGVATSNATSVQQTCCMGVVTTKKNAICCNTDATGYDENSEILVRGNIVHRKLKKWSQEEEALVKWFLETRQLPTSPFQLKQGVRIIEPQKFYFSLREDIACGARGIRARYEALQEDLSRLREIEAETLKRNKDER